MVSRKACRAQEYREPRGASRITLQAARRMNKCACLVVEARWQTDTVFPLSLPYLSFIR